MVTTRGRAALAAGATARWASRVTGRGAGAMIGGLVAMTLDRSLLRQLGEGRRTVLVTGTNGKSTTTRMTAAALAPLGAVATNATGANMDAGLIAALAAARDAELAALEVDEMHLPHVADAVSPRVMVLLTCRVTSWTGSVRSTRSSGYCERGWLDIPTRWWWPTATMC